MTISDKVSREEELGPVEVHDGADEDDDDDDRRLSPLIPVAIVFVALCGFVGWLLFGTGGDEAVAWSEKVDEVMAAPADYTDRELRVEGDLKQGSIEFRQEPCEWRFTLTREGYEMPVQFPQCVVPDTFRDGEGLIVTVQGRIQDDGTFLANQVVPRCPSKYEMQQRQQAGEEVPHSMDPLLGADPS